MKNLQIYPKLNLNTESEIFDYLLETLRESIFTWDYFVDWEKIARKVERFDTELNILNSLVGKKNSKAEFIKLIDQYPEVKQVLPLLIAVRIQKLKKLPIAESKDIHSTRAELKKGYFDASSLIDGQAEAELQRFYVESGLQSLLEEKNVKNLVDYYTGIEVGMDTNARKNRVGHLMEDTVENYLTTLAENQSISFHQEANRDKIKQVWGIEVEMDKANRRFDFVIHNSANNKLFMVETNFYSGGGTKLKSTAGEYRYLNNFLKERGFDLVWITDGLGWHTASNSLRETFQNNDYVFNLNMVKEGALIEVIKTA